MSYLAEHFGDELIFAEDIQYKELQGDALYDVLSGLVKGNHLRRHATGIYTISEKTFSDDDLIVARYLKRYGHRIGFLRGASYAGMLGLADKPTAWHIATNKESFKTTMSPFFENIYKSIETKGWVDIENEYYYLLKKYAIEEFEKDNLHELNLQLQYLQSRLTEYLMRCQQGISVKREIWEKIYSPIRMSDISIAEQTNTYEHIQKWWLTQNENVLQEKANRYKDETLIEGVKSYKFNLEHNVYNMEYPRLFMLPDVIMLLNFNYTNTADMYSNNMVSFVNHIHGLLEKPESMIFGYGDELDDNFKKLLDSNENECLRNIKSIKYQESDNYRNVLSFIESAPFQVCIMGHSCGNSDRTLLNTLFEHKNCISIKPYYYIKENGTDNYLDIIQNISRNFTDMKLMRDRVVNKTYCEPLA